MTLDITLSAVEQIRKMMAAQEKPVAGLRLGVKPSGCSGLEYVMDFVPKADPADQVLDFPGLKVFVDGASAGYLEGMRLDWGGGLLGTGFKFSNPNADRTCGCGKSFSV